MRKIDGLGEDRVQRPVERARRGEVAAERLLDARRARCAAQPDAAEAGDRRRERARRDGEVVQRPLRAAERARAARRSVRGSS